MVIILLRKVLNQLLEISLQIYLLTATVAMFLNFNYTWIFFSSPFASSALTFNYELSNTPSPITSAALSTITYFILSQLFLFTSNHSPRHSIVPIVPGVKRLPPPSRTDTLTSPFASRGDGYDDDDPLCKTATYMEPVQFKRNFRSDAAPSTKSNNSISNYFSEQERDMPLG